ncbi:MAG: hypothetical protein A2817_01160 [Candidatus Yanofskybacteria bacterium RIFCSPHIGHO2_01_FULL_39_8b]|uniref:Glycosyl transferase family 1 domain-containing protein n=1 Tax=Candidatus Yanofskybacteria bacterium RIFCSPHIGHO2_01_FULL_39_8b TaxID=1802659 RepID=A0A1F8EFC0_9BACT|nr:hypothetical protein [uncultured bacterium]OGM99546.1 MAG: hypothetical protein A2817_01160 [Candidatus Yanofskybacteria bacterium RIFCSPHIGHO2_01_FULL_39_8b]
MNFEFMIFIVGYPYIGERHKRVFNFFKKKDDLVFILPEVWKMKNGKVVIRAELGGELKIVPAKTNFFHSHYPIIRGHLKGWMPAIKNILKKMAKSGDVLYTVSEPNLFGTYLNGKIADKLKLKHVIFTWQNVAYRERLSGLKLKATELLIRKNIALSRGIILGNSRALDVIRPYMPDQFPCLVSPVSGIDTKQFKPGASSDFRAQYGLENKTVVLFVGALDYRKGIFKLVDVFAEAGKQENSLHLFMIGSGPLDEELKKYVVERDMSESVTILPWIDNKDLPGYFSSSDIFIYPSQRYGGWEEQFGYSIAEASSSGLPVISTRTGSIEDLIVEDQTGMLVEPDDSAGMISAMLKLARDPVLRKSMGEAGREFIKNNFSHEIIAGKLENFLRAL